MRNYRVPLLLNDMPLERVNRIFLHPMHQEGVGAVVELITALRQCRSSEDYFQFQQGLLVKVLAVQEHRAGCRRVAKLLQQGKRVPANAPELRSNGAATGHETWELEALLPIRADWDKAIGGTSFFSACLAVHTEDPADGRLHQDAPPRSHKPHHSQGR
jgi:hypothetical protein